MCSDINMNMINVYYGTRYVDTLRKSMTKIQAAGKEMY